jgi:hypothetical protein
MHPSKLGDFNDRYSGFALDPVASVPPRVEGARRPFPRTRRHVLMVEAPIRPPCHSISPCTAGNEGNNIDRACTPPAASQSNSERAAETPVQINCIRSSLVESLLFCLILGYMRIICTRALFSIRLRFLIRWD